MLLCSQGDINADFRHSLMYSMCIYIVLLILCNSEINNNCLIKYFPFSFNTILMTVHVSYVKFPQEMSIQHIKYRAHVSFSQQKHLSSPFTLSIWHHQLAGSLLRDQGLAQAEGRGDKLIKISAAPQRTGVHFQTHSIKPSSSLPPSPTSSSLLLMITTINHAVYYLSHWC